MMLWYIDVMYMYTWCMFVMIYEGILMLILYMLMWVVIIITFLSPPDPVDTLLFLPCLDPGGHDWLVIPYLACILSISLPFEFETSFKLFFLFGTTSPMSSKAVKLVRIS